MTDRPDRHFLGRVDHPPGSAFSAWYPMMHRIVSSLAIAMFLLGEGYKAAPTPRTLRVLTYNIHHGEGTDGNIDLPRQAEIVKSIQPDLVALQEVDQRTERTSGVNQLEELARLTGMHAQFGKAMDYSGGSYGVAVLSRWPFVSTRNDPLPAFPDREPRTALTVLVQSGCGRTVAAVHEHAPGSGEGGRESSGAGITSQCASGSRRRAGHPRRRYKQSARHRGHEGAGVTVDQRDNRRSVAAAPG